MCGIIGVLGSGDVVGDILGGLSRLEYRGYDSAGVAVLNARQEIERRRAPGKLKALEAALAEAPIHGAAGIGHTRWATHGAATEANAHPHASERVTVVHNGIIENYAEIRERLAAEGVRFESDTDTEVIAQLITHHLEHDNLAPAEAAAKALSQFSGAFAFAVMFAGEPDLLFCAQNGSPLVLGLGDGASYIGSDAYSISALTNRVLHLEVGEYAVLTRKGATVFNAHGAPIERAFQIVDAGAAVAGKGRHRHFMAKEIHEQPEVIAHTLTHYVDATRKTLRETACAFPFADLDRLTISGCGTAYYAGLVARGWFEGIAGLRVDIDVASELRYRTVPLEPREAALFISQSGETADTLAALRAFKKRGAPVAAIVNAPHSTMAREVEMAFATLAGPEIGVASTKAFTCQLMALACIALGAAKARGRLDAEAEQRHVSALLEIPRLVNATLELEGAVQAVAQELIRAQDVLFIGRGPAFPLALEGALKLKETSYIHAEGFAAGELKHGAIALIEENVPVVVIAPPDALIEKTLSNMQEVIARGARAIVLTDESGAKRCKRAVGDKAAVIELPRTEDWLSPFIYAAPLQMLAYCVAVLRGADVDQPRNLAKSVTVE